MQMLRPLVGGALVSLFHAALNFDLDLELWTFSTDAQLMKILSILAGQTDEEVPATWSSTSEVTVHLGVRRSSAQWLDDLPQNKAIKMGRLTIFLDNTEHRKQLIATISTPILDDRYDILVATGSDNFSISLYLTYTYISISLYLTYIMSIHIEISLYLYISISLYLCISHISCLYIQRYLYISNIRLLHVRTISRLRGKLNPAVQRSPLCSAEHS